MDNQTIKVPGTPLDEFKAKHGEDAIRLVPSKYIISWNRVTYVLDGWNNDQHS